MLPSTDSQRNNIIHRFHPVGKLGVLILVIFSLLFQPQLLTYILISSFLFMVILLCKISPSRLFKNIKPLCYFLTMIATFHLFFTPGNSIPPFPIWKIDITWEGLLSGAAVSLRFLLLILASSILALTTPPMDLAKGLERLFSPLGFLGIPVSRFSKMLVLTMQFIPVVFSEGERAFKEAAKNIPDFPFWNFFGKIPYLIPVVETIFLRSLQYAGELAETAENGKRRTVGR